MNIKNKAQREGFIPYQRHVGKIEPPSPNGHWLFSHFHQLQASALPGCATVALYFLR